MPRTTSALLPKSQRRLARLGDRLRTARLRRRLTAKIVAERAGMSLMTLRAVERGTASVTIGAYSAVLEVLGLQADLDRVADADELGRELVDAALPIRVRRRAVAERPS